MKSTPASASPSSRKKKTTITGNRNESRTINNWFLQSCTHSGTTNQFSSRHPRHENWISLKRQTIIFEEENHFCSLIARNGPEWFLTEIRNATAKKSYKSQVQLRIPEKKPSKGAAVFPEVKRMMKRLKRTPANLESASSTLNHRWFRSGRLNRPGLNQRKLQCSLAVTQIGLLYTTSTFSQQPWKIEEKSELHKVQLNRKRGVSPTLPPSTGGRQTTDYMMSLIEILTPWSCLFWLKTDW